mgnify:FL=1|tara:strand:+ start:6338 stop:7213 length:876 start_codon:yes stop_codon:yes gene_type:complete
MKIAITMCAWRRPDNLEKVLDSIIAGGGNANTIYLSIDGGWPAEQKEMVECVTQKFADHYLKPIVEVHPENIGAPNNLYQVLERAFDDESIDAVIHLEDDTVVHPQFFEYMRESLERYKDTKEVFTVSGYSNSNLPWHTEHWGGNNVGLRSWFTPWGWALWRRTWDELKDQWFGITFHDHKTFDPTQSYTEESLLELGYKDEKGAFDWPMRLLWRKNRFEVAPDESLVQNIGNDRSLYAQEMTHAAIQHTNRYYPEKRYDGFDFEMLDMELAELRPKRADPRPVEWWEGIE